MNEKVILGVRFNQALEFAQQVHFNSVRKGTHVPYISHLLQVTGLVLEFGGSEDEAIGALLHDAAEDEGGEVMLAQIEHVFGHPVAEIVRANSDSLTHAKHEKGPWKDRKVRYISGIPHKTESACLVSICDKIHNARSLTLDNRILGPEHWERFNASKEDSLWYYQEILSAFEARVGALRRFRPAMTELRLAVGALVQTMKD